MHRPTRPGLSPAPWRDFIALLALVVLAEPGFAGEPHFEIERVFGFNAWFGFLVCAALIIGAKAIGRALKRPDTYYREDDRDA